MEVQLWPLFESTVPRDHCHVFMADLHYQAQRRKQERKLKNADFSWQYSCWAERSRLSLTRLSLTSGSQNLLSKQAMAESSTRIGFS